MSGAEDTAPSSSVNRGSAYAPPSLSNGQTTGIPGRLALRFQSPGTFAVDVLQVVSPPDAATNKGKLLISGSGDAQVLSFSDGSGWRSLTLGATL